MNPEDKQKDQKWGWIIVIGNIISFFVYPGHVRSFGVFVVPIQSAFGVNSATVSSILTVRSATIMISALSAPGLSDRFTERKVVIIATFIHLIGPLIIFFANNIISFYAWAVISGFCYGFTVIPTQIIIGKYFRKRRSLAITICSSGGTLGQLILPPLCAILMEKYSLYGAFLIVGGISFNCAAAGALMRPLPVQSTKEQNNESTDKPADIDSANMQSITHSCGRNRFENGLPTEKCFALESTDENVKQIGNRTEEGYECEDAMLSTNEKQQTELLNRDDDIHVTNKMERFTLSMVDDDKAISMIKDDDNVPDYAIPACTIEEETDQGMKAIPKKSSSVYEQLKEFLHRQFDVSLLRLPRFVIVVVINGLCFALIRGCKIFLIAMAKEKIMASDLSLLLTVNACMDIPGRIGIAMLIDSKVLQAHHIVMLCSLLSAVATCFYPITEQYWSMMVVAAIMGVTSATAVNMSLPVVAELVGDLRMSKGLGWYTFAMAFIPMIVIQILGSVRDATGGYDAVYYLSGVSMIIIILAYLIISFIIERASRKPTNSLEDEAINEPENIHLTSEVVQENT